MIIDDAICKEMNLAYMCEAQANKVTNPSREHTIFALSADYHFKVAAWLKELKEIKR